MEDLNFANFAQRTPPSALHLLSPRVQIVLAPGSPLMQVPLFYPKCSQGISCLSGEITIPDSQAWQDAVAYCRSVITAPQDSVSRANSPWVRSCSDISRAQLQRFGPGIIEAARKGTSGIVADHFKGTRLDVPHIDKKQSFYRNLRNANLGVLYYPPTSTLAVGGFEPGVLPCSLGLSAFLEPEAAVRGASVSIVAVCDDCAKFTSEDFDIRLRLIAIPLGYAYEIRGQLINAIIDGSMLQCVGTGDQLTIEAAMAWRVISGCTSPNSGYIFGKESFEGGFVLPEVEIAMHDLLDWWSDLAAGNHENGVSATYGLGIQNPFHEYLEATMKRAAFNPKAGGFAIAAMTYMHFAAVRYGAYGYQRRRGQPCPECVKTLEAVTMGAGLAWNPKPPPKSFGDSASLRWLGKLWVDEFKDCGSIQEGLSWFQDLLCTGEIWIFDALTVINKVDNQSRLGLKRRTLGAFLPFCYSGFFCSSHSEDISINDGIRICIQFNY
ncbi:hypothetical protein VN97_g11599 [Penicillium thymicola]|uniref:Uncharacterized protein n=1 Tax=Penicillium thymicola TaxID=293382 RepID=A0AAI9X386_PENTH|nr:hypothetical protein VN97_g11599 [Penicillium thymicola]